MPIKTVILLLLFAVSGWCYDIYNPLFAYAPDTVYSVRFKTLGVGSQCAYKGTFKQYVNRITGQMIYIPDKGEYTDARGFRYTGVFDYLPLKYNQGGIKNGVAESMSGGGVYIFAGERVDELFGDEKTTGVFISAMESPLVEYGFELAEATPDYMTQLYERSTRDVAEAAARPQETAVRNEKFGLLLNVLSGVLSIAGGNINGLSGLTNAAAGSAKMTAKAFIAQESLTIVKKTMTGEEDFKTALKSAAGDSIKQVIKNYGGTGAAKLVDAFNTLSGS